MLFLRPFRHIPLSACHFQFQRDPTDVRAYRIFCLVRYFTRIESIVRASKDTASWMHVFPFRFGLFSTFHSHHCESIYHSTYIISKIYMFKNDESQIDEMWMCLQRQRQQQQLQKQCTYFERYYVHVWRKLKINCIQANGNISIDTTFISTCVLYRIEKKISEINGMCFKDTFPPWLDLFFHVSFMFLITVVVIIVWFMCSTATPQQKWYKKIMMMADVVFTIFSNCSVGCSKRQLYIHNTP